MMDWLQTTWSGLTRLAEAGSSKSTLLMAGGAFLLTFWFMRMLIRRSKRAAHDKRQTSKGRVAELKRAGSARGSVESLMVDAEELTRRLAAHMENRAQRLELLIAEADQRIALLENLAGPTASQLIEPGAIARNAPPTDPLAAEALRLAESGKTSVEIAQALDEQVGKIELILALHSAAASA